MKKFVAAAAGVLLADRDGRAGALPSLVRDVRPEDDEDDDRQAGALYPGANHAQLIFDVLGPDGKPMMENGKPVQWGVEGPSAASLARQGVAPKTFPDGSVFTVRLYPLRDGRPFGAMAGLLIFCGNAMPAGGCTKETGKVLLENANNDA